jgi:bacterioferritin-associated ferredoxin
VIVCVCNALRENQVRAKARACGGSVGRVYASLGCKAQCGQCLPFAREVIRDARIGAA